MTKDEQQPLLYVQQGKWQSAGHVLHTAEENSLYVDIYNLIKTNKGNDPHRVRSFIHTSSWTQNEAHERSRRQRRDPARGLSTPHVR